MEKSIDTLSEYGSTFQTKTLSCLLSDKTFLNQIYDILSPELYDSEAKKWIVEKIVEYYDEYGKSPTPDYLEAELKNVESETLQVSIVDQTRKAWDRRDDDDLEYVKDEFLEFAKNQRVKLAVLNSLDSIREKNYGAMMDRIKEAMNSGTSRDIGHVYKEEVENRLKDSMREGIPTGWDIINEVTDGGLAPGELGVIVAPSGAGKSWTLSHIGLSAVQRGYNVAHYTLELDQNQTGLRYDSLLSGVPPNEVREHQEEIQKAVGDLDGDLTVKYYPTKSASVQTLQAHFDKQQAIRGRPDMILIDYADLLAARAGERSDNTYLQMGNIYNQLRKLAGELQVPIWTVSQATRNAIDEDVIEADMIADSYKKIMISDFILSLSRKKSDKLSNTARLHVMKNRVGRDGMVYPCIMSVDNGKIEVYDPESKKGIEIKNEMDKSEGEAEMDLLKGKYRDHKRKKNGQSENGHMSSNDLINDLVGDEEEDEEEKSTGITV